MPEGKQRKFIDLDRCPIGSRRRCHHHLRFAHSAGNSLPLKPAPPWPLNHVSHHRPYTQRGMRSSVMQAAVKIFHSTLRSHKLVTCGGNGFLSPVWSTRATADRYRPTIVHYHWHRLRRRRRGQTARIHLLVP